MKYLSATQSLPILFVLFALSVVSQVVYGDFISKFCLGFLSAALGVGLVFNLAVLVILLRHGEITMDNEEETTMSW
jgi:hypothetical protein